MSYDWAQADIDQEYNLGSTISITQNIYFGSHDYISY